MTAETTGTTAGTITVTDHHLSDGDGTVFARSWTVGGATGAPLVLLHESLGSTGMWKTLPVRLAEATGRTVISYDRPGYGRSTPRTDPPGFDFIEREVTEVFPAVKEQLGIGEFLVLGHSVGGAVALRIAATDGDCLGVISESAQAYVEDLTLDGVRAGRERFADPDQLAKLEKWHGDRARWVVDAWTEIWLDPGFRTWRLEGLEDVRCPVLVIHGEDDEYGSLDFARTIAEGVGGPARTEVTATGHIPHLQAPEQVLRVVAEFVAPLG